MCGGSTLAVAGGTGETAMAAAPGSSAEFVIAREGEQAPSSPVLTNRPANWAQPLSVAGVPNLYKVGEGIYRSAQPTADGIKNLKAMGIKTIINLRMFHTDHDEIGKTAVQQEDVNMTAWHPEQADAVQFLKMVADPSHLPALFHCQHGSDRTGTMCAVYRIAVQGWTKEAAIQEMVQGGYGFHSIWSNLPKWIDGLDIEKLRAEAGIRAPQTRSVMNR